MIASDPLSEMLATLLGRPVFRWKSSDRHRIQEDCVKPLAVRAEPSGL